MVKIFAQEDFKGPDGRMVKKGEVVCQIPKIYGLERIVQLATLGIVSDHEPAGEAGKEAAKVVEGPGPEERALTAKR